MAAISDMTLLERWVDRRDPEAFAEIVRRHSAMVYATGLRVLRDGLEAEDVAQDCFIKLAQSADSVKSSLAGWLHTAATRRALDRIRSESRRREREQAYADAQPVASDPTWSEIQVYVDEAIAELPEDVRDLVVRHFLEGVTHDGLAAELGVSRSTVTRRIQRGTEEIRAYLATRGIAVATGVLGGALLANATEAAPAALINALGKLALAGSAGTAGATAAVGGMAVKGLASYFTAKTVVAAFAVAALVGGAYWSLAPAISNGETAPEETEQSAAKVSESITPSTPEPTRVAAAVTSEAGPSGDAEVRTITGTVKSDTGFARKGVQFCLAWPSDYIRDGATDKHGAFTLAGVSASPVTLLASCAFTHRSAVVTLAPGETGPIDVTLDCATVSATGRVVDSGGEPVAGAQVQFRVTYPNGSAVLFGPATAWKNGYYESGALPAKPGATIEARVVPPTSDTPDIWTDPVPASLNPPLTTLPEFVAPQSVAIDVAEHQTLDDYEKHMAESERIPLGGVVQDESGQAVAGALVDVNYQTESSRMSSGSNTYTGTDGRWKVFGPADATDIEVRVACRDFITTSHRNQQVQPPIPRLKDQTAVITLKKAVVLKGRVVNGDGKPVADAVVNTGWLQSFLGDQVFEDSTTDRTDSDGAFEISTVPAQEIDVRVSHPDYAPAVLEIEVVRSMPDQQIVLSEGSTVRGRVMDESGQPLPEARISLREWRLTRQHRAIGVDFEMDEEGNFTLSHVPEAGELTFSIGMSGRRNRGKFLSMSTEMLVPREAPYEIVMFKPPVFRGAVTDAETGEVIPDFKVRTLWQYDGLNTPRPIGMSSDLEITGGDGTFMKKVGGCIVSYPPVTKFAMKVYAEGYQPRMTPAVALGEPMDVFALKLVKGDPWRGTVTDSAGAPIADAHLAWIGPAEMAYVSMGRFRNGFTNEAENTTESGADGAFSLPDTGESGYLLALHDTGYAIVHNDAFERGSALKLLPWAKVQGTIYHKDQGEANAAIWMKPVEPQGGDEALPIVWDFQDSSHVDGRFEFEFVPALSFQVGRLARAHQFGDVSHGAVLTPTPGQTHRVDIGAGGLKVEGRFDLAALTERTGKPFDPIFVHAAALAANADGPEVHYVPRVEPDGHFTIEALPPGAYDLKVTYHAPAPPRRCGAGIVLAEGAARLEVAGAEGATLRIDDVLLAPVAGPSNGSPAPELAAITFEGKEFQLAALKGRYVLLDFWATWCPPCVDAMGDVQAVREQFSAAKNLEFVGINFDQNAETAKKFVADRGFGWTQLVTDDWSLDNVVVREFLIGALPSLWLIDPEGNVVARDIEPDQLAAVVEALP